MSWFFKGRGEEGFHRLDDRVWLSQEASDAALLREYESQRQQGVRSLIVFFFEGTFGRLRSRPGFAPEAETWQADGHHSLSYRGPGRAILLFAEHYPLPDTEERALDQVRRAFPDTPEVVFYCSLDDAFMKAFASEQIKALLGRLGMKEEEMVASGWTTEAIRRAQKKIAKKVDFEIKAQSAEEWFERNCPR